MKNFASEEPADGRFVFQSSGVTQHLCALLSDWSRQTISAWLENAPRPKTMLESSGEPDDEFRRNTPLTAFVRRQILPRDLRAANFFAVGLYDSNYPDLLSHIPDPPLVLFCLGDLAVLEQRSVALVGARQSTGTGRGMAHSMAAGLAVRGCTVVSGLALGIDAAAHRGALTVSGGKTVAVLGSGFGHLYPKQNRGLAKAILRAGGLLMSEYPSGMGPRPYQFPERNRLISGLSELTVLVEAGVKSGSLITARLALEQGRDLCAVPGPALSPLSAGCHRMIRQGAALVTCVEEIAEEMGGLPEPALATGQPAIENSAPPPSETSAQILEAIAAEPRQLDEIAVLIGRDPQPVSQCLMELQLSGVVRHGPDGYIRLL